MPPERGRHYDWLTLKAEYVGGYDQGGTLHWPTFDDLGQRHSVNPSRLRERAATEEWTEERAAFQRRVALERNERRVDELASLGADLDVHALRIARAGLALTGARLQEMSAIAQARQEVDDARKNGQQPSEERADLARLYVDQREVAALALAAQRWYSLGGSALGDVPTTRLEVEGPSRPARVEHHHTIESRDAYTGGIIMALVEANALPPEIADALGIDVNAARAELDSERRGLLPADLVDAPGEDEAASP